MNRNDAICNCSIVLSVLIYIYHMISTKRFAVSGGHSVECPEFAAAFMRNTLKHKSIFKYMYNIIYIVVISSFYFDLIVCYSLHSVIPRTAWIEFY